MVVTFSGLFFPQEYWTVQSLCVAAPAQRRRASRSSQNHLLQFHACFWLPLSFIHLLGVGLGCAQTQRLAVKAPSPLPQQPKLLIAA